MVLSIQMVSLRVCVCVFLEQAYVVIVIADNGESSRNNVNAIDAIHVIDTLKICDFRLARAAIRKKPSRTYTYAIDIWCIGCIFAELMLRKPLFPGKNDTDQLDMITDLLGTPSENTISEIQGDETRKYLRNMCIKSPVPFAEKFPNSDPQAIKLLQKLLVFDPRHRPTAEEVLADTYFKDLEINEEEPSLPAISSDEFEFENPLLTMDKIRELMYHEILEHHPQTLQDHLSQQEDFNFTYPRSALKLRAIPSTGPKPNQSMTAFEPTAAIEGRLLDFDDKVRAQAVSVVSDLEFQRNEDAMEAAPSKLQHGGGESLTSTEEANEAQCGCTVQTILFFDLDVDASVAIKEESKRNDYAM